jgi:hypothetical protein
MTLLSISWRHSLKLLLQKAIFNVFLGWYYNPSPTLPSDQTTAPSDTHIKQHEERPIEAFPPQPSIIMVSSRTYQKISSNGIDLAELVLPLTDALK